MNLLFRLALLVSLFGYVLTPPRFAYAQRTLYGSIADQYTREPLSGASISAAAFQKVVFSDANGQFRISGLPAGQITIDVRIVGYAALSRNVQVASDSTFADILIEPESKQLKEVIVTGLAVGATVRESPVPIMTYSKVQWLQTASTNLVDAVVKLPGMSQITTGVGLSKPVIRGLGFNRVITVHDGVRQEDNQWGEEHALQIDEYSIDRYEIIKGAGSLLYGSDGLGGVMSLISARPLQPGVARGQVLTNYQTNNGMMGVSAMIERAGHQGYFSRLRVSGKSTGNYKNAYDGRVFNSSFRELNVNGMVGVKRWWGHSQLMFSNWHQDINIVTGRRNAQGRFVKPILANKQLQYIAVPEDDLTSRALDPLNYQSLNHAKVSWNNYIKLGGGNLLAILSYSQNRRQEFSPLVTSGEPALYFNLQNVYYDIKYFRDAQNGWELTLGTSGLWQNNRNQGIQILYPGYSVRDNGVVAFLQKKTDRLTVNGGVRMDIRRIHINSLYVTEAGLLSEVKGNNKQRFAGLDKTYANPTASLGLSYALSRKFTAKANVARGFRAPTTPELSANGEHAGTFRYEIGNPNLRSEVAFQSDMSFVLETRELTLLASLFRNAINNYTYFEKVLNRFGRDSIVNPARPVLTYRYVQGNAVLYGIEAQAIYTPSQARWLQLTGTYSSVWTRNLSAKGDSAKYLPFIPPPRLLIQVKVSRTEVGKHLQNGYAQLEVDHNQAQNQALLAFHTETRTPAYTLLNIGAGADVVGKKSKVLCSVYLSVNNLLDKAYQSHQNRLKYLSVNAATGRMGVFNMGRNASIKVLVPLKF